MEIRCLLTSGCADQQEKESWLALGEAEEKLMTAHLDCDQEVLRACDAQR